MNPKMVAKARTARLVREANTPKYSTDTVSAARKAKASRLARATSLSMSEDFCHVCGRCTDHRGEHTDEQVLAWAAKPGLLQSAL